MSIFTTLLELILSKIPEKNQRPPPAGRRAGKTTRLAGKNFLPLKPFSIFARSSFGRNFLKFFGGKQI